MSKKCWYCDWVNEHIADDFEGDFRCETCGVENDCLGEGKKDWIGENNNINPATTEEEWLQEEGEEEMATYTEPKKAIQYTLLPEKEWCKVKITSVKEIDREFEGNKSKGIQWEFTSLEHTAQNLEGNEIPIKVIHSTGKSMKWKDTFGNANKLLSDILKPESGKFDENEGIDAEQCKDKEIEIMVSYYLKKDGTKGQKLSMIR